MLRSGPVSPDPGRVEPVEVSSIGRALELVGDRWAILVLRDAFRGIVRFEELHRDLGVPKAILADRLRRLVDHGVLEKRQYSDRPARYEYRLTQMGRDLSPALVALMRWGDRYLSGGSPPTVLVHDRCGHELDLTYVCWHCNETFTPDAIRSRPGPGATGPTQGARDA